METSALSSYVSTHLTCAENKCFLCIPPCILPAASLPFNLHFWTSSSLPLRPSEKKGSVCCVSFSRGADAFGTPNCNYIQDLETEIFWLSVSSFLSCFLLLRRDSLLSKVTGNFVILASSCWNVRFCNSGAHLKPWRKGLKEPLEKKSKQ